MKNVFLILFFISYNYVLFGQKDVRYSELPEITISANKYETPIFLTASTVSVITSEQIKLKQSNSVVDLLKDIPGLSVSQQGGTGKLSSIFMRGANSNFVLVMIDNVEVNDPSSSNNAYDISSLQVSDIERIEIVRGPQSTLYGADAAAGIINIFTKSGMGEPSYRISAEGGTNSYYKGNLSSSGEISGLNYLINLSRLQTDDVSSIKGKNFEADGYSNNAGFLKLSYNLLENFGVNFSYKFTGTETDLDQSEKDGDDPNFVSDFESHLFNINLNGSFFEGIWESNLRGSFYKSEINAIDKIDDFRPNTFSNSNYSGKRASFNWQNNLKIIDYNIITIGFDSKIDEASSFYNSENMFGEFSSDFPVKSIQTTGAYIQNIFTYNNLSTTVGYRYDNNEKFGSVSTFRIAPLYYISITGTKLKGTYGTGFKAPSLFNLFAPFYGNSELKPEKSEGWDLGIEQFLLKNKVALGVTYFKMQFEDMLGFDENFKTININQAETSGFEAILKINNIYDFTFNASYTYNKSYDLSTPGLTTQQLIRRPKNQFSISTNYAYEKLNLNLLISYSGEKFDNDFSILPAERVALNPYTLVNFNVAYAITEYLTFFGRVENLFDEEYQDILYYGNLGRSGYLGFELTL